MNVETSAGRPGIVFFAAILNFVMALLWIAASAAVFLVMGLGVAARLSQTAASYVPAWTPDASSLIVLVTVGVTILVVTLSSAVMFLFVGVGLLKGNGVAWYLQAVLSVLGLFFVPIGTALNALILVFLFQKTTRDFFKIR